MSKNVLFSVIVPAYNSANFIDKCIESVITQTYTDFELIIVNDGSKDATQAICEKYADADPRIRVINKENGGHTSARNEGLINSTGEYVLFLDSDDWLSDNVLHLCKVEIEKNAPDIIIYNLYNTLTKKYFGKNVPFGFYNLSNSSELLNSLIMDKNGNSAFVKGLIGKVFRRTVIYNNQLLIPEEIRIAEDAAAFVCTVIDSLTLSAISDATYFYFVREGSVSHSSDIDAFGRLPYLFAYYKNKFKTCKFDFSEQFDRYVVARLYTAALFVMRSKDGMNRVSVEFESVLSDRFVLEALKRAKFSLGGFRYTFKKFILRHRLWFLAKLLDK